jgi:adenylate cyclase
MRRHLRQWLDHPAMLAFGRHLSRLAALGTQGYAPHVRRRLAIMNVVAYLIALFTLLYVIQHLQVDHSLWRPVILANLALAVVALTVPFLHRFGEIVGGLTIALAELIGMFFIIVYLGRASGVHIQYLVFAAAPFVILGLERFGMVMALVVAGFVLHLVAWFWFPGDVDLVTASRAELDGIYVNAALTTFVVIAATVWYAFRLAEKAEAETDGLPRNILPGSVVERLKEAPGATIADSFEEASVLFVDLKGFVPTAKRLGPRATVELLNELMHAFDRVADRHGVEKIKTIGDAYMAAAGVPTPRPDQARALAEAALDMLGEVDRIARSRDVAMLARIGIATGPVMAGVIGARRLTYDVWGDTVNVASRLEGLAEPGSIRMCGRTAEAIRPHLSPEPLGPTEIRGYGAEPTWRLTPAREDGGATAH